MMEGQLPFCYVHIFVFVSTGDFNHPNPFTYQFTLHSWITSTEAIMSRTGANMSLAGQSYLYGIRAFE